MRQKSQTARKRRVGTAVFYILYLLGILAFFLGLSWVLQNLQTWLTNYEAAQPNVRAEQVFTQMFAQPDWEALYRQAGCEDTVYETASHYSTYMQKKLGNNRLQYHETSAGLSDDKRYVVTLQGGKIGTFTLTSVKENEGGIPEWELGTVEVFFSRQEDVRVLVEPDCTVYVNGVALADAHVIQTLDTEAENYLPEGVHGLRKQWMYLDGLLVPPQVTAVDAGGNAVELTYDETTRTYAQHFPEMAFSQEQAQLVEEAAKVYCRFMISQESSYMLSKFFDKNSEAYATVIRREPWLHENKGYTFTEPTFSEYYRYSDTLYSVMVTMRMDVKRPWDTVKEFPLQTTFFLQQQENGGWLVSHMTNVNVQQATAKVRLRYMVDGQQLHTEMVDATSDSLVLPQVTAPEGKTFTGWYRQQRDEAGRTVYALIFLPDDRGMVNLAADQVLESMTLYALFE